MDTNRHRSHALKRNAAVSQTSRSGCVVNEPPDNSMSFPFRNALRLVEDDIAAVQLLIRVDSRSFAEKK